jgi:NRPS condensation-like uncharacterized protein
MKVHMQTHPASALDLFTDSVRLMGDATLCAVMEFGVGLHQRRLEAAAEACLAAHPVLHSRLVRGSGPAYWEMNDDLEVRVETMPAPAHYHPLVVNPISPHGPRQFKLRILRRTSGDVLVINLAHAAADGFGLATLCRQLLAEYTEPGLLPPAEEFPVRDTLWTQRLAKECQPDTAEVRILNPMWPDPFGTSRAASDYHLEVIGSEAMEGIKRGAKRSGGTLNDVLMAAYFLAMSDLTGMNGPMSVFFPVNLRQHLKDCSRQMSNQSANIGFPLQRHEGEGMEEILPRVIAETKLLKAGGIGLTEQAEMDRASDPAGVKVQEMVDKMAALEKEGLADIFISNPGVLELPRVGGLDNAYICYPGGYMPTTCFVVSTFDGRMSISIGFQDDPRPRQGTKNALDLLVKHILTAVSL